MRGAKLFLEAVHRHGVRRVFGIVGGEAQAIRFDEVPGLDFFLTRHEFAAGIMADVCSRLDGMPNMCYSTFGPGVTNLATGVCSATLDRSPMLAVSAQIPRAERVFNQTHQCIDNVAVMGSMCKYARELDSVEEIPEVVTAALRAARAEVPGPVYISFPVDLMLEEIPDGRAFQLLDAMGSTEPGPLPAPDPADITWLSEQILRARRPVALGGNVLFRERATPELLSFLERYQIPLVTTLASKGLIPDDHPLHIGPCNKYLDGILHHPALDDVFKTADLMLLIGYDFGEDVKPSQWKRSDSIRTLAIGPNPNPMGDVFRPEREIIGSLKQALPMLSELAPKGRKLVEGERLSALRKRRSAAGETAIQSYPTIPVPAIVRTVRSQARPGGHPLQRHRPAQAVRRPVQRHRPAEHVPLLERVRHVRIRAAGRDGGQAGPPQSTGRRHLRRRRLPLDQPRPRDGGPLSPADGGGAAQGQLVRPHQVLPAHRQGVGLHQLGRFR